MFIKASMEKVKNYLTKNSQSLVDYFNTHDIFQTIKEYAKNAGVELIYKVLVLYYTVKIGKLPASSVVLVSAALGYFLLPIDIIPDFMGVVGLSDDAIAIGLAMKEIKKHITPEIKTEAAQKLLSYFPSCQIPELD